MPSLSGDGLIAALRGLRHAFPADRRPVLFPTNDHMVRSLASSWEDLEGLFDLSWAGCRGDIRSLLDKNNVEQRCRAQGLLYPHSWYAATLEELGSIAEELPYPVIVKPTRPLSSFKAVRLASAVEMREHGRAHAESLPFVVQRWIPGDDRQLLFGALCLDRGEILARFEGLKVRSLPRAMGQTTVAVSRPDDAVYRAAVRFFEGLDLSGPVSLEVKRDEQGRLWVIEPTVGRTDYWVDCCIANGVNLPYLEYLAGVGLEPVAVSQRDTHIWLDTEREPLAYLELAWQTRSPFVEGKWPRFAYLQVNDPLPALVSLWRLSARVVSDLPARLRRVVRAPPIMG